MNKLFFSILSGFIFALLPVTSKAVMPVKMHPDSVEVIELHIDTNRSVVKWKGTEMRESSSHKGTVELSKGALKMENRRLSGGHFIVDMQSITVTDIPRSDPIPRNNLTEHLKSEDFFLVEVYPTAMFEITQTEVTGMNQVQVTGDLTIRDVTRPISFTAVREEEPQDNLVYHVEFKIDRFKWNISYQGSYWSRITSIIDNTFVDPDIYISVKLTTVPGS